MQIKNHDGNGIGIGQVRMDRLRPGVVYRITSDGWPTTQKQDKEWRDKNNRLADQLDQNRDIPGRDQISQENKIKAREIKIKNTKLSQAPEKDQTDPVNNRLWKQDRHPYVMKRRRRGEEKDQEKKRHAIIWMQAQ